MKKSVLTVFFCLFAALVSAQQMQTVAGTRTYYYPFSMSVDEAKAKALEQLKIDLIADSFGTFVNMTTVLSGSEDGDHYRTIAETLIKGEWIKDLSTPEYKIDNDAVHQIVTVTAKGLVRELEDVPIDFDVHILCGGTDLRYETLSFKDGGNLYLRFLAPGDGYLSVYLDDGAGRVQRLFPYTNANVGDDCFAGGQEYVLFSEKHGRGDEMVDSISLYCLSSSPELNRLYAIWSPKQYARPKDRRGRTASDCMELTTKEFQNWLARARYFDRQMCIVYHDIKIEK